MAAALAKGSQAATDAMSSRGHRYPDSDQECWGAANAAPPVGGDWRECARGGDERRSLLLVSFFLVPRMNSDGKPSFSPSGCICVELHDFSNLSYETIFIQFSRKQIELFYNTRRKRKSILKFKEN
ncbi:hypothetical protein TNCT_343521 [Trichonephila clavata]|uniref:Uncharacterized protein n=1 Tax=Trichonephila clavata TaxID=2740835 RepID=A0A8X6GGX1_TRICU|nr:hypothetical protein TNCT_343521 [Trichonephila clavata]